VSFIYSAEVKLEIVFREVRSSAVFRLGRARGENDEFRGLQAGEKLIEFAVAGGDARDTFAFAKDFFESPEIVADGL